MDAGTGSEEGSTDCGGVQCRGTAATTSDLVLAKQASSCMQCAAEVADLAARYCCAEAVLPLTTAGWLAGCRVQERHMPAAMQSKVRQYYVKVWAPHAGEAAGVEGCA